MNKICILICMLMTSSPGFGFDPVGPPPAHRNIQATLQFAMSVTFPNIRFEETSVPEAMDFMNNALGMPKAYAVPVTLAPGLQAQRITFTAKNISLLDALARIADAVQADLKISEGGISLVPRVPTPVTPAPEEKKPPEPVR